MAYRAITRHFGNSGLRNGNEMMAYRSKFTPVLSFATATMDVAHHPPKSRITGSAKADLAPMGVLTGMVLVALMMGGYTVTQQLMHSPGVFINKKRREGTPEVDDPESVIGEADKFLNNSFFRKVGNIQASHDMYNDPVRANAYTKPREAETLRSVGV